MGQIIFWFIVLIISLIVLVKSADYFTEYSEKIGLAFGMSSFIIGATIVAIGTSMPELVSSLFAALGSGTTEFVADNIIGSNIANALLILGIGAIYGKTLKVETSLIDVDLPFFFMSMALFSYFAFDGDITRLEGLFLLGFFIIFIIYNVRSDSTVEEVADDVEELEELHEQYEETEEARVDLDGDGKPDRAPIGKYMLYVLISMVAISASAKYLIDSVLTLSDLLGIQSSLLTITVVALGTSLPEVLTSLAAIKLGNHGIAIGNVFGSNTFNLLLVGGFPALFTDLKIGDLSMTVGLPFLIIATFVAIFVTIDDKVRIWEGSAMLFLYVVFLAKIVQVI
ncbi:MAG: conjugal transfer protein TraR [Candidatus Kerfeldbacteria bacterium CG15_BIG_FIL_POST_REV_8_21_14_020_45_12]|uniref:Conjugal transfer protein TraR n=1 Tax=Candidatus Kerfeldbacteria bacterium CG15_BIG_FIL_POST_REV_8_21_14_020_45_12 TaxID=2014247 RepID=A0A2M7H2W0_9BACT|nr:MAG: conjugal transfer protein TraR [Candidatus Kerfeldbacteria bacterium CG15_BIG_FIL_POST_REV_8_21_14_020_45_12]PJA93334.1 MAG: conjugal transfer protein TraR [Candidatus Kerfeldbacteria bacterium CG_4_9_14_3_um_filter_45_8]